MVDCEGKEVELVWKSNNPCDMILLHDNKTFYPTDESLCEFDNGYKFLHYLKEKEDTYDIVIIYKGTGKCDDPYQVLLVYSVKPYHLHVGEYYHLCKDKEWKYI